MTDIRQSLNYANYLKSYGWTVEKVGDWNVFIKKFPLFGSLIKIQRITSPIPFDEIELLSKKHHAFKVVIEFDFYPNTPNLPKIPKNFRVCRSPFLPTKTIILDISKSEKEIFDSFPKEKRRLLKRLEEKKEIIVKDGTAEDFIKIKNRGLLKKHILPIGVKKEINSLWQSFSSENIKILIAYQCHSRESGNLYKYLYRFRIKSGMTINPLAGALFLFHDKKAHYWEASSTNLGKEFGAPSLLVWEGIKIAKQKGCEVMDLEGIYDERFPIKDWKGFTHFKKGFGGKEIEFPSPLSSGL